MTTEQTRALVRDLYAAYQKGDGKGVAELIHDDIDWMIYGPRQLFPFLGPRKGKQQVLDTLAAIGKDYPLERYEPETIIVENDRAAVTSNVAYKQASTGRTLSFRNVNLLRFQDGKMIEFREFIDSFDVAEQALGRELLMS